MKHCMGVVRTGSSVYGDGVFAYHSIFEENTMVNIPSLFYLEVAHKGGGEVFTPYFPVHVLYGRRICQFGTFLPNVCCRIKEV